MLTRKKFREKEKRNQLWKTNSIGFFSPCISVLGLLLACMLNTNNDKKSLFGQFALRVYLVTLPNVWLQCECFHRQQQHLAAVTMNENRKFHLHSLSSRNCILYSLYIDSKILHASNVGNGPIHWLKQHNCNHGPRKSATQILSGTQRCAPFLWVAAKDWARLKQIVSKEEEKKNIGSI